MTTNVQCLVPEFVARRLSVLAEARKMTSAELAAQALNEFASSRDARRAIRAHRRGASLADLGWIDDYEGQSVDDLLVFADSEEPYQLLACLEQAIQENWKKNPGSRTGIENIIMAVMALLREVNNGGFDQFFRNSSKKWAFFVGDALVHIGRKDAAKIAGRAIRAVGVPKTARSVGPGVGESFDILDQKMSTPSTKRDEILQECDIEFCNLPKLPASLIAYSRKHPRGILRS
jgi:predicted transcriptional regulator